jgi:anti-sigma regulatory factor (Ser/Thr protein kinase)
VGKTFVKTFEFPNRSEYLNRAREFVRQTVCDSPLEKSWHNKVVLAIDEAVSNIIEHAYESEKRDDKIEIEMRSEGECLTVLVIDHGTSFDPDSIPDVNMEQHVKARNKDGLGIFMIRQIMDEIEYTFKEGVCNELRLVKYYQEKS